MTILNTESVYYRYPNADEDTLKNISFSLQEGEIVGLLGPNGAGKSTLIKLLLGLFPPKRGQVSLFGGDPVAKPDIRKRVAVMHQKASFEQMMSGWDNLYIAGRFLGLSKKQVNLRVEEIEKDLGPFTFFDRPEISFSGGERRRLQIVRTLLGHPSLVLLDEPTTAIDVQGRYQFYAALKNIIERTRVTVLWTSHYLNEIESNCERVIILSSGEVIADSAVTELKQQFSGNQFQITASPESISRIPKQILFDLNLTQTNPAVLCSGGLSDDAFYRNIVPSLLSNGLELQTITKQQPNLEEVYLKLIENVNGRENP